MSACSSNNQRYFTWSQNLLKLNFAYSPIQASQRSCYKTAGSGDESRAVRVDGGGGMPGSCNDAVMVAEVGTLFTAPVNISHIKPHGICTSVGITHDRCVSNPPQSSTSSRPTDISACVCGRGKLGKCASSEIFRYMRVK